MENNISSNLDNLVTCTICNREHIASDNVKEKVNFRNPDGTFVMLLDGNYKEDTLKHCRCSKCNNLIYRKHIHKKSLCVLCQNIKKSITIKQKRDFVNACRGLSKEDVKFFLKDLYKNA